MEFCFPFVGGMKVQVDIILHVSPHGSSLIAVLTAAGAEQSSFHSCSSIQFSSVSQTIALRPTEADPNFLQITTTNFQLSTGLFPFTFLRSCVHICIYELIAFIYAYMHI